MMWLLVSEQIYCSDKRSEYNAVCLGWLSSPAWWRAENECKERKEKELSSREPRTRFLLLSMWSFCCFVVKYPAGVLGSTYRKDWACFPFRHFQYIHIIYVPSSPWDLPRLFRREIWPFAYEPNVKRHHRAAKQPDETLQQKWKPGYCAQTLGWRLYPVRWWQDLLLWMSMNSSRTEQNAINYSASRCPACLSSLQIVTYWLTQAFVSALFMYCWFAISLH